MKLKRKGILTFTGMMLALDEDTKEYFDNLSAKLDEIDPSSILLSISIPIHGTPFYEKINNEGRIVDFDLSHYEGDHLVFSPKNVSEADVMEAFINVNRYFYSWKNILKRWWRLMRAFSFQGRILKNPFKAVIISMVLFKLSIFQRDHAMKKVYPVLAKSLAE
jgi:hypothetical protein